MGQYYNILFTHKNGMTYSLVRVNTKTDTVHWTMPEHPYQRIPYYSVGALLAYAMESLSREDCLADYTIQIVRV